MYNTRSLLDDEHGAKEASCESTHPVWVCRWEVQEQVRVGGLTTQSTEEHEECWKCSVYTWGLGAGGEYTSEVLGLLSALDSLLVSCPSV